jgi:hypothetical protein
LGKIFEAQNDAEIPFYGCALHILHNLCLKKGSYSD